MKKYLFLILFCFANNLLPVSATNIGIKTMASDPVKKIAREIARSNIYEYPGKNEIGKKNSEQNIRYEFLLKMAGTDELIKLATKNKNAVVRLYAYRAIVQKFKEIPKDILEQFNNDHTIVATMHEGVADKITVSKIAGSLLY